MNFELKKSLEILERTPRILTGMLAGLSETWTCQNEGEGTWSPFDIVGHLVHGEKTDWIPRMKIILEHGATRPFEPFDRFAQFEESKGKSLVLLLEEFDRLRGENLRTLKNTLTNETDLDQPGKHPELGAVNLRQLLATWTVHDLGHIAQVARVMAKQYDREVGPWKAYLGVLH